MMVPGLAQKYSAKTTMNTARQYVEYLNTSRRWVTMPWSISFSVVNSRTVWPGSRTPLTSSTPQRWISFSTTAWMRKYTPIGGSVKSQYNGAKHVITKCIGVLSLVHITGEARAFTSVDFRIFHPASDGETKQDHFCEMLMHAVSDKNLLAHFQGSHLERRYWICDHQPPGGWFSESGHQRDSVSLRNRTLADWTITPWTHIADGHCLMPIS